MESLGSQWIQQVLAKGETLYVEFKSDRGPFSDKDLIAAIVALANTEGGDLFLGVEDDGRVTGLHSSRREISSMPALIANKTNPSLQARVETLDFAGTTFARIQVPKSRHLVSTSDGLLLRRRVKIDGKPEAVPFYPHEFIQRQSTLGLIDPSAMPLIELSVSVSDLDPLERARLRESIRRNGGDISLLQLSDHEFDGAIGLVTTINGVKYPTLAGLLFIGREEHIRRIVPTYEIAFQVLEGMEVRVNEFFHKPLLQAFEEVERFFHAQVREQEFEIGLFRIAVPNFERRAFREALVNALVHRDYSRLGAVHIRIDVDNDTLTISNPGGFVEGVTLQNILITEPRPRNPLLADVAKRIGLAERTGRGIDRIFEGLLRYGRPAPDYGRSDSNSVVLRMSSAETDLNFVELVLREEDRSGRSMPLDSLILLSRLRHERRLSTASLTLAIQKSEQETRSALEKLTEAGLVSASGTGRGRAYTLSASLYRKAGRKADYIRQVGFDSIQHEQMVLRYIREHGAIKRSDVADLCRLSMPQAYHLLQRLKKKGLIEKHGLRRHTYYTRKE